MKDEHKELEQEVTRALQSLRAIEPPDEARRGMQRAAFMAQVRRHAPAPQASAAAQALRQGSEGVERRFLPVRPFRRKRWALAGVVLAMILVFVAGTGGAIYAADAAVPGGPLYGLDQAVEATRLRLTSRPEAVVSLLLAIAEERLEEARILLEQGDLANMGKALDGYGSMVSSLTTSLGEAEQGRAEELAALVDSSLSVEAVGYPLVAAAEPGQADIDFCTGAEPHPVAAALAETYPVNYGTIMGWFCEQNLGLGEIMLALETWARAEDFKGVTGITSVEDLLGRRTAGDGWGQVWQDLGLIGKAAKRPVGPPAAFPVGPPEMAKVPEDVPAGPARTEAGLDDLAAWCVGVEPHPVAEQLAEAYEDDEVDYDQIMAWFCDGFGLGEIKLALETSRETDTSPGVLLAESVDGGWGLIWQKYGLIGKGNDDDIEEPPEDDESYCVGVDPHPVAQKLSDEYDIEIDEIMRWFCEGRHGLGEIKLALESGQPSSEGKGGPTPGDLLSMRKTMGWGEIWQHYGMIGKPDRDEAGPEIIEEAGPGKDKPLPPGLQKPKKPKPVKPPRPPMPVNPGES
ncbi:MAG: DUF5667 domain-containing protein [Anaerolineae bacterium]